MFSFSSFFYTGEGREGQGQEGGAEAPPETTSAICNAI